MVDLFAGRCSLCLRNDVPLMTDLHMCVSCHKETLDAISEFLFAEHTIPVDISPSPFREPFHYEGKKR